MEEFDRSFSGCLIDIAGGVLEGVLALGCSVDLKGSYLAPKVRSGRDGAAYFRMGRHDTAQCAIVMSSDGRVGALWLDDFQPLFDSPEYLIEDCALWSEIVGWKYVAVSESDVTMVLEWLGPLSVQDGASTTGASWWRGAGIALVAHPYLSPQRDSRRQVFVLASAGDRYRWARNVLEENGYGERCRLAEELWGTVGTVSG